MAVDLKEALEEHQRGNLERATRLYEVVLRGNPDHPDALYLLGLIAIQTGNPQRAVLLIGRAATLRPGDPVIHANLGEAYRALGDTKRTIES
jgi:Flp pilus assembly protein TadD